MIELKITINTVNDFAGAEITSYIDTPASELELKYLKSMLPTLKDEDNEIARAAERLLEEHLKESK